MALLAEQMRPTASNPHSLLGPAARIWKRDLTRWREQQKFHIIFWGPPGSGKTTLARMLAEGSGLPAISLSAVKHGVKEIREAAESNRGGLLFIDEIHRLNKSQQDVLLPILEEPQIWMVGATTENPSVTLNPAIMSRVRTIYVKPPAATDIETALERGLASLIEASHGIDPQKEERMRQLAIKKIAPMANGDIRFALNLLEALFFAGSPEDEEDILRNSLRSFTTKEHYDWISAMIKSLRGSDPDAALFYAMMALDSGEDPLFILRRCVIFASEDVGNADPQALGIAVNAYRAVECVGLPEGSIPLAQCVTYLASTVKSNRSYLAMHKVREWRKRAEEAGHAQIAPPRELTRAGSAEYRYPHDFPDSFVPFEYLPAAVAQFREAGGPAYVPSSYGAETKISARLAALWNAVRRSKS